MLDTLDVNFNGKPRSKALMYRLQLTFAEYQSGRGQASVWCLATSGKISMGGLVTAI
jgi:hypothetical protein